MQTERHSKQTLVLVSLLLLATCSFSQVAIKPESDLGLVAPVMNHHPLPHYDYDKIDYGMNMGLEQTAAGRIWSCWTGGGDDPNSFLVLIYSDDGGKNWSKPALIVDAQDPLMSEKRAVQNGTVWRDPLNRLWLFFDQSINDFDGRAGLWYSICENPDAANPRWSDAQRLWHGTGKSKPIVLKNGLWVLPVSLLNRNIIDKQPAYFQTAYPELDSLRMAHAFVSNDEGKTWHRQGAVRFPDPSYDEHHILELKNGKLWMTARTNNGIWESFSSDNGKTWSTPQKFLPHISSRHFIRRLASGNIVLVKHGELDERTKTRSKLKAFLSDDEGKTWKGGLMLDERRGVSYPDGFQSADGLIYVSYDRNRATDGHIMMASFSESDILNGEFQSAGSKQKQIIAEPKGLDKQTPPSHVVRNDLAAVANRLEIPCVIVSEQGFKPKKAVRGAKVFSDKNYSFQHIPNFLEGMDYLQTPVKGQHRIHPVTEGYLIALAPENSPEETRLVQQDFVKLNYESLHIVKGLTQKFSVYKKYVGFKKFRLGHVEWDGFTIVFFKNKKLASQTIPAKLSWMPKDGYHIDSREWQGCPSIEITGKRLWATWFSGGKREPDNGNYGIISYSDDGINFVDPAMVIYHSDSSVRVMDTELWTDPEGKLWIFWTQNTGAKGFDGQWSTWAINTGNPEAEKPIWSSPKRLSYGLMRNKPIVLQTGEWLMPSYDWVNHRSTVYLSSNKGKSWKLQGGPLSPPDDNFYEHMMVQLKNGNVWMLQRNIQSSVSDDKGKSWTDLDTLHAFTSANSRLYLGRLQSGKLLLIYNNNAHNKRNNLTAYLSDDDGKTWPHQLLIDARENVSYPEAVQESDGRIRVIYDRSRGGAKEILMATFLEADIIAGEFKSELSKAKQIISKAGSKQ